MRCSCIARPNFNGPSKTSVASGVLFALWRKNDSAHNYDNFGLLSRNWSPRKNRFNSRRCSSLNLKSFQSCALGYVESFWMTCDEHELEFHSGIQAIGNFHRTCVFSLGRNADSLRMICRCEAQMNSNVMFPYSRVVPCAPSMVLRHLLHCFHVQCWHLRTWLLPPVMVLPSAEYWLLQRLQKRLFWNQRLWGGWDEPY